ALQNQRPHERYNQALSRTVSEKIDGKEGYKKYLELIKEVRERSEKDDCSIEEAVKKILGKK
ncbi:MAG: hypothetical protein KGY76_03120, partial [Candidatus Thermoplasmatota archaeon]|nr:hypothetical protein [Candidatus Thermoplasmatota archaeon]